MFGLKTIAALSIAQTTAATPWENRYLIPSGCLPALKVPDGGRCLFADQCRSGKCDPFYRTCLRADSSMFGFDAQDPIADDLRLAMIFGVGGDRASDHSGGALNSEGNEGRTQICDKKGAKGVCDMFVENGISKLALKSFDLTNSGCQCDERFLEEHLDNSWTGATIEGVFLNFCDPAHWAYAVAEPGASECPWGSAPITDSELCFQAAVYLQIDETTVEGHVGVCVNDVESYAAKIVHAPSSNEQILCMPLAMWSENVWPRTTTTTPPPTVAKFSGEFKLTVSSRATFCGGEVFGLVKTMMYGLVSAVALGGAAPMTEDEFTMTCEASRRLSTARRLDDDVDVKYEFELQSDDPMNPLSDVSMPVLAMKNTLAGFTPATLQAQFTAGLMAYQGEMEVTVNDVVGPQITIETKASPTTTVKADTAVEADRAMSPVIGLATGLALAAAGAAFVA